MIKFKDLILGDSREIYDFEEMNEVSFSDKNISKVAELYGNIMGKKMGGKFKALGFEDYKRKSGPGKGLRMMNESGEMLRFNWDAKKSKAAKFDLTSIDYWAKGNMDFTKPTRTVAFGPELNVIQVLEKITDALLTGSIHESMTIIDEARSHQEKIDWLEQNNLKRSLAGSKQKMKDAASGAGILNELEIFLGEQEANSFDGKIKKIEKEFSKQVYADPDTVFEDIEDLLSIVAAGKWRTLVICGMGGIGKTFHVTEGPRSLKALLGAEGGAWTYHSGTKAAPFSLYKTLFQERNKIIVFDEADSLLKNDDIVMMLKPVLDTSGSNLAEYMAGTENMVGKSKGELDDYASFVDSEIAAGKMIGMGKKDVKLPSKFHFSGGMIFISNMRANQIEGAIMSRSIFIDVHLAQQDVIKRIKTIAKAQASNLGISVDDAYDVVEALSSNSNAPEEQITYMTPEFARKSKQITVRAFQLGVILKKSGLSRWKELAQLYA